MEENAIRVIHLIGSIAILFIGTISIYVSYNNFGKRILNRILFLISTDFLIAGIIRLLNFPFKLIDGTHVVIFNGVIGLIFLIFVLMEFVSKR